MNHPKTKLRRSTGGVVKGKQIESVTTHPPLPTRKGERKLEVLLKSRKKVGGVLACAEEPRRNFRGGTLPENQVSGDVGMGGGGGGGADTGVL